MQFPVISAYDQCGLLGPLMTSVTLSFAPEEVSSISGFPMYSSTALVDIADLPCGPQGWTSNWHCHATPTTYQPYIVLPSALTRMAPEWSTCLVTKLGAQDPPHALLPAKAMVPPAPTGVSVPASSVAMPSPTIPHLPTQTSMRGSPDLLQSPNENVDNSKPNKDKPGESINQAHPSVASTSPSKALDDNGHDLGAGSSDSSRTQPKPAATPDPNIINGIALNQDTERGNSISPQGNKPVRPQVSYTLQSSPSAGFAQDESSPGTPPTRKDPSQAAVLYQGQLIRPDGIPISIEGQNVVYHSGTLCVNSESQPVVVPTTPPLATQQPGTITVGGLTFNIVPAVLASSDQDPAETGFTSKDQPSNAIAPDSDVNSSNSGAESGKAAGNVFEAIEEAASSWQHRDSLVVVPGTVTAAEPSSFAIDAGPREAGTNLVIDGKAVSSDENVVMAGGTRISPRSSLAKAGDQPGSAGPSVIDGTNQDNLIPIGGQYVTSIGGSVVIHGHTLKPGDVAITIEGTSVSLGSSELFLGTKIMPFLPHITPMPKHGALFTVGGIALTPMGSEIAVDGTIVASGASGVKADGLPVSLGSSVLVVGSQTISFPGYGTEGPQPPIITMGTEIITEGTKDAIINGQTLFLGGQATIIDDNFVSLDSSTVLIVGSSTKALVLGTDMAMSTTSNALAIATDIPEGTELGDSIMRPQSSTAYGNSQPTGSSAHSFGSSVRGVCSCVLLFLCSLVFFLAGFIFG